MGYIMSSIPPIRPRTNIGIAQRDGKVTIGPEFQRWLDDLRFIVSAISDITDGDMTQRSFYQGQPGVTAEQAFVSPRTGFITQFIAQNVTGSAQTIEAWVDVVGDQGAVDATKVLEADLGANERIEDVLDGQVFQRAGKIFLRSSANNAITVSISGKTL